MDLTECDARYVLLKNNSKIPAKKYKNHIFTKAEIKNHLKHGGNLGLLSQPNLIFIDLDTETNHKGSNGVMTFLKWCTKHHLNLEDLMEQTLVQQTASGGLHLIFKKPHGMSFKQDISFLNGVDIKASNNNYIVIEPSKIDGHAYHFINQNQPIVLPKVLADALEKHRANQSRKKIIVDQPQNGLLYHESGGYPRLDVFYNIEHGFGEHGLRNNNLLKWSSAMRRITTKAETLKYAEIANQNTADPLSEQELRSTIESSFNYIDMPKTKVINGIEWVVLKHNRHSVDDYAVLKSKFEEVRKITPDAYDDQDLYLYGSPMLMAVSNLQTVYNYGEDNENDN